MMKPSASEPARRGLKMGAYVAMLAVIGLLLAAMPRQAEGFRESLQRQRRRQRQHQLGLQYDSNDADHNARALQDVKVCAVPTEIFELAAFVRIEGIPEDFEDGDEDLLALSFQTAYNNLASCPQEGSIRLITRSEVVDISQEVPGFGGTTRKSSRKKKARKTTYVVEVDLECNSCKGNQIDEDEDEDEEDFFERLFRANNTDPTNNTDTADDADASTRRRLSSIFAPSTDDDANGDGNDNDDKDTGDDQDTLTITINIQAPVVEETAKEDANANAEAEADEDLIPMLPSITAATMKRKLKEGGGEQSRRMIKANKMGKNVFQPSAETVKCTRCLEPTRSAFVEEYNSVFSAALELRRSRRRRQLERGLGQSDRNNSPDSNMLRGQKPTTDQDLPVASANGRGLMDDPDEPQPVYTIENVVQVIEEGDCNKTTEQFETFFTVVEIAINTDEVNITDPDELSDLEQDILAAYNELNFYSTDTCDTSHRQFNSIESYGSTVAVNRRRLNEDEDRIQSARLPANNATSAHRDLQTTFDSSSFVYLQNLYAMAGQCISCSNSFSFSNDITFARRLPEDPRYKVDWTRALTVTRPTPPGSIPDAGQSVGNVTNRLCYCPIDGSRQNRAPSASETLAFLESDGINVIQSLNELQLQQCSNNISSLSTELFLDEIFASYLGETSLEMLTDGELEAFEECAIISYELASLEVCDSNFISIEEAELLAISGESPTLHFNLKARCRGCDPATTTIIDTSARRQLNTPDIFGNTHAQESCAFTKDGRGMRNARRRQILQERLHRHRRSSTSSSDSWNDGRSVHRWMEGEVVDEVDEDDGFDECFCEAGNEDDTPTLLSDFLFEFVDCVNEELDLSEPYPSSIL